MNFKKLAIAVMCTILVSACTNKQIYEATQPKYTEAECMTKNLPKTEYEACVQKEGMSYEEYERDRTTIMEK
jgi:hypothetical protein